MMWFPDSWYYDTQPGLDRAHPPARGEPRQTRHIPKQDVELVEICYSVIASEALCAACRRALVDSVRVDAVWCDCDAHWSGRVSTRCRGWRRHRHEATVALVGGELRLGPLRLR